MLTIRTSKLRAVTTLLVPLAVVAVSAGCIGFNIYDSAPAHAINMQFSQIGTHPRAAALRGTSYDFYGPRLHDLAVSNGKLYAGYGDWDGNSDSWGPSQGRTALVPFDIASRTFESASEVFTGSEAITNIRSINGSLYVPTTDPSIHGSGGYATNESGAWEVKNAVPDAVHVFDVTSLNGTDLWLFGARDNYPPFDGSVGRAVAWRSTDNEQTWTEAYSQGSDEGQGAGYERYYWGQRAGSRVFTHAAGTVPELPTRSFDGSVGFDHPDITCGDSGHRVIEFQNKIICPQSYINQQYYPLIAISGDGSATPVDFDGYGAVADFFVDGSFLYVLDTYGGITRTNDLENWTALGNWQNVSEEYITATSIAVYNDRLYVGDSRGNIYESGETMSAELSKSGPETCFEFDGAGTITKYFERENDNVLNPLCSLNVVVPSQIDDVDVTTIGAEAFDSAGIESLQLPAGLTTIEEYAFHGNELADITLPQSLTRLGYGAFSNNNLQSVSIPNSLSVIDSYVFAANQITSVTIPESVTSIQSDAFSYNQLESLTLPSSVTNVQRGAFQGNNLTSLVLSSNMTSIAPYVFAQNELKQVTIPSNITEIDRTAFTEQSALDPPIFDSGAGTTSAQIQNTDVSYDEYLSSIWYVRLYTQNPTNPNNLVSDAMVEHVDETYCGGVEYDAANLGGTVHAQCVDSLEYTTRSCVLPAGSSRENEVTNQAFCGGDFNGDGDMNDIYDANYGGHLINPAFVAVHSETTDGATLEEMRTLTGSYNNSFINGYMVKNGPVLVPSPEPITTIPFGTVGALAAGEPNTITLSESYFAVGQTIQVPASSFPGYTLASGDELVSITLTAALNEYTFVYELSNPSLVPGTPNTGGGAMVSILYAALAVAGVLVVAIVLFARKKRSTA